MRAVSIQCPSAAPVRRQRVVGAVLTATLLWVAAWSWTQVMRRRLALAQRRPLNIALVLSVAVLGWATARPEGPLHRAALSALWWTGSPVYSIPDVDRALAQSPGTWLGRTVLIQGRVAVERTWSPPDSIVTRLALIDPRRSNSMKPLYLQWGHPDPLLAALRRLPVLGRFMPPPQRPQVGWAAIYRVRLDGLSTSPPGSADAILLDADPDYR